MQDTWCRANECIMRLNDVKLDGSHDDTRSFSCFHPAETTGIPSFFFAQYFACSRQSVQHYPPRQMYEEASESFSTFVIYFLDFFFM